MPDVGRGAESEDRREGQEKKPDDFIPQGVKGLDDGGHDVFEKRARLAENLLPHHFIVTGGLASPRLAGESERTLSDAPTVMTFFAVPGDSTVCE